MRIKSCFFLCMIFCSTTLFGKGPFIVYQGHHAGMFASFLMVVGLLDAYDRKEISGVGIDLPKTELYYDGAYGPNWWYYYFLPLRVKEPLHTKPIPLSYAYSHRIAKLGQASLSRQRCHDLIDKYIRIKSEILHDVKNFLKENIHGEKVIGIHYRGTDKFNVEADYVAPETVFDAVTKARAQLGTDNVKIFVATDDGNFLQKAIQKFGDRVIFFDFARSTNGQPIHINGPIRGYIAGKMALLDCLMLSKCDILIRTASNLSNVSMILNPNLPIIRLNKSNWDLDR